MKKQSYFRYFTLTVFCVAILFAGCDKGQHDAPGNPGNPDNPDTPGADESNSLGWLGDENDSEIPDDILFLEFGNAPSKVDLSPKLPPVGNQGNHGTCVAWATAYYQRTALQAIRQNWSSSQLQSAGKQFSPKDLFLSIPSYQKGQNCEGTLFEHAYQQLIDRGVATQATVPYQNLGDCSDYPLSSWTNEANDFPIESYRDLPVEVAAMKAKLAEDRPLVFGAWVTQAFKQWKGSGVMRASDVLQGQNLGGHAMTIVGYDDSKQAFRIVNSWGTQWGDNGFAWVDYDLMTNREFTQNVFVAYDKPADPDEPLNPSASTGNLAVTHLFDFDDPDKSNARYRTIEYNVANTGSKTVSSSRDWNVYYLYYNAFDANDYGVILDLYISNDYGDPGETGENTDGAGSWYNQWFNTGIPAGALLSEQFFGDGYETIFWSYRMPPLNGFYYLVMIADPFNVVEESNDGDNFFFITANDGGPIWFDNGIGSGFQSGGTDDRSQAADYRSPVNTAQPNAYRPEEIKTFLHRMKTEGKLPRAAGNPEGKPATAATH